MRISDWSSDVCSSDLRDRILDQILHDLLELDAFPVASARYFGGDQGIIAGLAINPAGPAVGAGRRIDLRRRAGRTRVAFDTGADRIFHVSRARWNEDARQPDRTPQGEGRPVG